MSPSINDITNEPIGAFNQRLNTLPMHIFLCLQYTIMQSTTAEFALAPPGE